jgi:lipoteichoic acid synthase
LVIARALLPEPVAAQDALSPGHSYGYNILELDLSLVPETAGSALLAEMNSYYLFRIPTAKNAYTGTLAGKNLIVICADNWLPQATSRTAPTYFLWQEGLQFSDVYRPDWYQGMDGKEFALLTGLIPTTLDDETALLWAGEQNTYLPYALGQALSAGGYDCYAFSRDEAHADGYAALGFSHIMECTLSAQETLEQTMPLYLENGPFFAYYVWTDPSCEDALAYLMTQLEAAGQADNTVLCLLTGHEDDDRAQLFLWAQGLSGTVDKPCSELDVTPTLLNLLGLSYDSRFLSGADVLAQNSQVSTANDATPLVSLYGSAYSDWITDAGRYDAQTSTFVLTQDCFASTEAVAEYASSVKDLVYDRYIYTRRAMQMNYFQLVLSF